MESGCSSFLLSMVRMTMTMAAVCKISLLLLCCSVVFCTGSRDACDTYITAGANFTVPLHHQLKSTEKLRWKFNSEIIFNLKAEHIFKGSEKDIFANGSLKLTNVLKNQTGTYSPEVFGVDGKRVDNLKGIRSCVLDPLPKPTMTFECQKTKVKFTCTAKGFSIKWLQENKVFAEKKETVTQDIKQATGTFSCQISNQASSMTSNSVTGPCQTSVGGFPETIMGISVWIFVGGGGAIVLVLIIITIVCCVLAKRKKRMQLKDEEELRLEWTNPQQQQQQQQHECRQHNRPPGHHHHHHHSHHQQQQPAGHTGPRQNRAKQQRPRAPDPINGQPQPSPRRPAQTPRPVVNDDEEQPPPLPQPRKKAPKTPRM